MKTERLTGRSTHAYFLVAHCVARLSKLFHFSRSIQCTCTGSRHDESSQHVSRVLKNLASAPQSFLHLMSCRHLLCQPEHRSIFPDRLETEPGIPCIDPGGCGWFGRVAEQYPLTGYEPKNLIEIFSQHTPINFFFQERSSFSTHFNDVPTTAASDATDTLDAGMTSPLFTQERQVNPFSASVSQQATASGSSNPQQPASPNVIHLWQTSKVELQQCAHVRVVRSCGQLQRSDCSDVEKSLLNGKSNGEFGSALSQEQERFLSEREHRHDYLEREARRAPQGE